MYKICAVALAIVLTLISSSQRVQALDDTQRQEARERVTRASELFEQEDYAAALAEFKRVLEVLGSHASRAVVLHNIGQCHERMFEYDEALRYYHSYLSESEPDAPEREGVKATIRTLEGLLATLQVSANVVGTEVWLDGRRVGRAPLKLRIPSGRHVIEGKAQGRTSAWTEMLIAAGNTRTVKLAMTEAPKPRRVPKSVFYSAAAASAVSLATGIALGAITMRQRADLRARLRDDDTRFAVGASEKQQLAHRALATDILFVSAGLLSVSTLVLYYFTDFAPQHAPMQLGLHPRGMAISGSF